MSVTLTDRAAAHVRAHAARRGGDPLGLRLGVKPSGCSGMAYVLEFADAPREGDLSFATNGVTILVDPKSLIHVAGTELDYVREGLQEGFRFNNPNVKDACGCGESFTT